VSAFDVRGAFGTSDIAQYLNSQLNIMKSNLSITRIFRQQSSGRTFIVTTPHPVTKNEAWSFTDQQLGFLADSAGVSPAQLRLVAPGCQLVIEGAPVKAGDKMINARTGEEITFTKDHFRVDRSSIVLSQQAQMMALAAGAIAEQFNFPAPAPAATIEQQPAEDGVLEDVFQETEAAPAQSTEAAPAA